MISILRQQAQKQIKGLGYLLLTDGNTAFYVDMQHTKYNVLDQYEQASSSRLRIGHFSLNHQHLYDLH